MTDQPKEQHTMNDPTRDAIRRIIADAEPMWRDTAVDKLASDIADALTWSPATVPGDAVERAARAAAEHIGWQPGIYDAIRAALAAAPAEEAEPEYVETGVVSPEGIAEIIPNPALVAQRGGEAECPVCRRTDGQHKMERHIREVLAALGIEVTP